MISLAECKHGYLYKIRSRNLNFGVYNENYKGFIGIREKFNQKFLFTEFHRDTGPPCGTVRPISLLKVCPIEDLEENNDKLFEWLSSEEENG